MREITITEARQMLKSLAEQFPEDGLIITRNGQPVLALMSYQAHKALLANVQSLQTVLEIMLGGDQASAPRPARPDKKEAMPYDKSISWEEFQKEVGWG